MTDPKEKLPTWPEEALSEPEKESPVPEFTLKGHHTKLEQQVADFLESRQISVFKPSYPDLLVYNKETKRLCFVEVKSRYDTPSYRQNQTFKIFRKLGLPVVVVKPDDPFVEKGQHIVGKRFLSTVLKAMCKCQP